MKNAIIYLHGFNSASLGLDGKLLTNKPKLLLLQDFCRKKKIEFCTPNVDYRDFKQLIIRLNDLFDEFQKQGCQVCFMGSSMGGFTSEYMAVKKHVKAFMINPAISPSELLTQFIGVNANFETGLPYEWTDAHCDQYKRYEEELNLAHDQTIDRTVFVDSADELIDSTQTIEKYRGIAQIISFAGGSHSFEHMEQALPVIENVIFANF